LNNLENSPTKLLKKELGSNYQSNNLTPMMNKVSSGGMLKISRGGSQQVQNIRQASGLNNNKFPPKQSVPSIAE